MRHTLKCMECKKFSTRKLCVPCRARYVAITESLTALCALFKGYERYPRKDRGWRSVQNPATKHGSTKTIYFRLKESPTIEKSD